MFRRYAKSNALDLTVLNTQALTKSAAVHDFEIKDGMLYTRVRAISARINRNGDAFPSAELKKAYLSFVGRPVFVNHVNSDHRRTRGVIVSSVYVENGTDKYIELVNEIDAKSFPRLAREITSGNIDSVSMGCFIPGTPITMADGTKKNIEDIVPEDLVLTHLGKPQPVENIQVRPHEGLMYDIRTYGQSTPLILTPNHPVWIKRKAPSRAAQNRNKIDVGATTCSCGQDFVSYRSLSAHIREAKRNFRIGHERPEDHAEYGFVNAEDVRNGDYVLTPAPVVNNSEQSSELARLIGYYASEGNLGYDRKRFSDGRPVFVEWNFNSAEIGYIQSVSSDLLSLGYKPAGPYIKNNCASIRCNSPELAKRFQELCGEHSWGKKLDSSILGWEPENLRHLIMAYFDGDGSYRGASMGERGESVQAGTASKALADQLFLCGIRSGIQMVPPTFQHSPTSQALGHRPKYVLNASFKEKWNTVTADSLVQIDSDGVWRKVTSIGMKEYTGNVYNFQVENDHSYVASDVAVHNCDVLKSTCSHCGNEATEMGDFCDHILSHKLQNLPDKTGKMTPVHEICSGLNFFEISYVFDPADETAVMQEVIAPKTAIARDPTVEVVSPANVDTLRSEEDCPNCGAEDYDGTECKHCGHYSVAELEDPDLSKAKEQDKPSKNKGKEGKSMTTRTSSKDVALERAQAARRRIREAQQRLADAPFPGTEEDTIVGTPAPEAPVATTDEVRNQDDSTNVQDLDSQVGTDMSPDETTNVTVQDPIADVPAKGGDEADNIDNLGKKDAATAKAVASANDMTYHHAHIEARRATKAANSDEDTYAGHNYARAAHQAAAACAPTAAKRDEHLNWAKAHSQAAMNRVDKSKRPEFVAGVTAADDGNGGHDGDGSPDSDADAAKPDARVDVTAPVADVNPTEAQETQYNTDEYEDNGGDKVKKEDESNTNIIPGKAQAKTASNMHCDSCSKTYSSRSHTPGDNCPNCGDDGDGGHIVYDEGKDWMDKKKRASNKASSLEVAMLVDQYVKQGLLNSEDKFNKWAEFESLSSEIVKDRTALLSLVASRTPVRNDIPTRAASASMPRVARSAPVMGRPAPRTATLTSEAELDQSDDSLTFL